jgi:very-short-patch-repair endonuclease
LRRMDNLADRFEISATRWARAIEAVERAYPIPKGSLDAEASIGWSPDRESDAVAIAGVRLLAGQAVTSAWLDVCNLLETCESPIELPMVLALVTVARHHGVSVGLISQAWGEYGDRFEPSASTRRPNFFLRIEPQAQLGEHRVDFCLTLDGSIRGEDGRTRSGSQRMVIECDGHDYHERTKEQAKRDRERDRLLQSFGFLVYRYTGQEIWEDVFACAAQAIESLREPVRAVLSGSSLPPG